MSKTSTIINCYDPPIEFFIELVQQKIPFGFCKLNHVFWETAATKSELEEMRPFMEDEITRPLFGEQAAFNPIGWLMLHGFDLLEEVLEIIQQPKHESSFLLGASHIGPPDESLFVGKLPYEKRLNCIKDNLPIDYVPFLGSIWKKYALNGTMPKFFNCIKPFRVVVVGLNHLSHINKYTEFSDFKHIEIKLDATKKRKELLDFFLKEWKPNDFWIFQAGETLSTWFIHHLNMLIDGFFIDAGRSLDMFLPSEKLKIDREYFNTIPDFYGQYWMQNRNNSLRVCERDGKTIQLGN